MPRNSTHPGIAGRKERNPKRMAAPGDDKPSGQLARQVEEVKIMRSIRISRSAPAALTLLALLAFVAISGTTAKGASAAVSQSVTYDVSGTASTNPVAPNPNPLCGISDVFGCPVTAQGTVTNASAPAGAPTSGTFTLTLSQIDTFPPNPCRAKTANGTLRVDWTDGRTTTASLSGRFHDSKPILYLSGTTDASSTAYPPNPWKGVLVNFPPNPCVASSNSITGTITLGK